MEATTTTVDWTILDAFDSENSAGEHIGTVLQDRLGEAGKRVAYFKLNNMNIAPCRSCGACGYKSPGKCVMKDDIHEICRAVARSGVLVFLTPVRFGGYPSQLKKTTERFMTLGMPTAEMIDGRIMHPMRYGRKSLLSIGVTEMDVPGQQENFRLLGRRNARNLISPHHKAMIFEPTETRPKLEEEICRVVGEALQW